MPTGETAATASRGVGRLELVADADRHADHARLAGGQAVTRCVEVYRGLVQRQTRVARVGGAQVQVRALGERVVGNEGHLPRVRLGRWRAVDRLDLLIRVLQR